VLHVANWVSKKSDTVLRGKLAFNVLPQVKEVEETVALESLFVGAHTVLVRLLDLLDLLLHCS